VSHAWLDGAARFFLSGPLTTRATGINRSVSSWLHSAQIPLTAPGSPHLRQSPRLSSQRSSTAGSRSASKHDRIFGRAGGGGNFTAGIAGSAGIFRSGAPSSIEISSVGSAGGGGVVTRSTRLKASNTASPFGRGAPLE
jgi:hypothetical protein